MEAKHGKPKQAEQDDQSDKTNYQGAQHITGLELSTLYSKVSRRQIPHYRLGKRLVVFSRAELERWMADRRVAVEAKP